MALFESELAARVAAFRANLLREKEGFPSRVADLLEMSMRPRVVEIEDALRGSVGKLAERGFDMWAGKKVVDISDRSWGPSHVVVPDIPGLAEDCVLDAESELSDRSSQTSLDYGQPPAKVPHSYDVKVYDLQLIFADTNVTDKFGFSPRFLQGLRLQALEHPGEAAASAQERIRAAGYPNYKVTAGGYAKSRSCAKSRVNRLAKGVVNMIPAVGGEVIGNLMLVHCTDTSGAIEWTVTGPLMHAQEIMSVFGLVLANGPFEPVFALQIELELLDITVFDGVTDRAYSPSFIGHMAPAGIDPMGCGMPDGLTAVARDNLTRIAAFVEPVQVDGVVVGSAVRVNSKFLLVNEHVLEVSSAGSEDQQEPGEVTIAGSPFVQRAPVSRDLFVVEQPGVCAGWVYRSARIGEKVIMCYSVGDGNVEYSSVSSVVNFDASSISVKTWPEARPGTSGAAIVALTDGALLGIYSGPAMSSSMCTAFTQEHYGRLSDLDESSSSMTHSETTDAVLGRLDRRGLTPAMTYNLEALVPLAVQGQFAGVAARVAGQLYTTLDPDVDQIYAVVEGARGQTEVPVVFDRYGQYAYACANSAAVAAASGSVRSVGFSRRPELSERVMVLSKDGSGPYVSFARRVCHVGASGSLFHVKDIGDSELNFSGGIVVAERDGAIVGQFVARVHDEVNGTRMRCVGVPVAAERAGSVVRRVTGFVSSKYPALNPVTWSEEAIEAVFTHASVRYGDDTSSRYAMLGASAVQSAWMRSCMEAGVPVAEWVSGSRVQLSLERKARLAAELGLADLYCVPRELVLGPLAGEYADLLDGFLGLVSEFEKPDNFRRVCGDLGLLCDSAVGLGEPVAGRSDSSGGAAAVLQQAVSPGSDGRTVTPRPSSLVEAMGGSRAGLFARLDDPGGELSRLREMVEDMSRRVLNVTPDGVADHQGA